MKTTKMLPLFLVILAACVSFSCDMDGDPPSTTTTTSTSTTTSTTSTTTTTTLAPEYTVDFDARGGTAVSSEVTDLISDFPASSKPGYALEGWFSDDSFASGGKVSFPYAPVSDITLVAKWIPATDGLQYDSVVNGWGVSKGVADTAGNVVVPEYWLGVGVVDLGMYSFQACLSMTSITLPSGIANIATDAFRHCTALQTVYLNPEVPPLAGALAFEECYALSTIKVPGASVASYKVSDSWKDYASIIVSQ